MTVANSVVTCFAVPGIGSNLGVSVTVGGQTSATSAQTLRYVSPVVSGLSGLGAANAPTTGGTQIVISGSHFGPLTPLGTDGLPVVGPSSIGITLPLASYSRSANSLPPASGRLLAATPVMVALNCFVSVADVQIICTTAPGVGFGLVWSVTIGSQTSAPSNATSTYAPPSIADYTGPGATSADTTGYQSIAIEGHNSECRVAVCTLRTNENSTTACSGSPGYDPGLGHVRRAKCDRVCGFGLQRHRGARHRHVLDRARCRRGSQVACRDRRPEFGLSDDLVFHPRNLRPWRPRLARW